MEPEISIEAIRNEVLRKIGRNVVLFQQLEGLITRLTALQNIAGPVSALKQTRDKRREAIDSLTMGQLVGEIKKQQLYVASIDDRPSAIPDEITEPWLAFTFRIEADAAFVDSRRKALSDLVAARNNLIHGLLPQWKTDSIESSKNLEVFLDEQAISARAEIAHFQGIAHEIRETAAAAQAFIDSEAGSKAFHVTWLQQSRIVLTLGDIARQKARPDGWTCLSTAGHILKQHAPGEYGALQTRYKCKTLLDLIVAADLFEIQKERTPNGGARVIYRINPNWTLRSGEAGSGVRSDSSGKTGAERIS